MSPALHGIDMILFSDSMIQLAINKSASDQRMNAVEEAIGKDAGWDWEADPDVTIIIKSKIEPKFYDIEITNAEKVEKGFDNDTITVHGDFSCTFSQEDPDSGYFETLKCK